MVDETTVSHRLGGSKLPLVACYWGNIELPWEAPVATDMFLEVKWDAAFTKVADGSSRPSILLGTVMCCFFVVLRLGGGVGIPDLPNSDYKEATTFCCEFPKEVWTGFVDLPVNDIRRLWGWVVTLVAFLRSGTTVSTVKPNLCCCCIIEFFARFDYEMIYKSLSICWFWLIWFGESN